MLCGRLVVERLGVVVVVFVVEGVVVGRLVEGRVVVGVVVVVPVVVLVVRVGVLLVRVLTEPVDGVVVVGCGRGLSPVRTFVLGIRVGDVDAGVLLLRTEVEAVREVVGCGRGVTLLFTCTVGRSRPGT